MVAAAAGAMVTLPQPGQTLPLGTTSLVSPKSWSICCFMQPMVEVCAALSVACCRLTASCAARWASMRLVRRSPSASIFEYSEL